MNTVRSTQPENKAHFRLLWILFVCSNCLVRLTCDHHPPASLLPSCFLPGRMYGADDFLPMLTYVLAQCDMPQLDTEIQYMMELLDPSLLQGEGRCWRCAHFK